MSSLERSREVVPQVEAVRMHAERLSKPVDPPPGTSPSFVTLVRHEIEQANARVREKNVPAGPEPKQPEPEGDPGYEVRDTPDTREIEAEIRSHCKVYQRWPESQVRVLYQEYERGKSLRQIAHDIWEEMGYTSEQSCAGSLNAQFKRFGLPCRDRLEARRVVA